MKSRLAHNELGMSVILVGILVFVIRVSIAPLRVILHVPASVRCGRL